MSEESLFLSIGNILKNARENKEITLRDAEIETKIRYRYLKALEDNNFTIMPGPVYTKGFIKSYCKLLEIDSKPLLNLYEDYLKTQVNVTDEQPIQISRTKGSNDYKGLSRLAVIAIALLFLYGFQHIYFSFINGPIKPTVDNGNPPVEQKEVIPPKTNPEPVIDNKKKEPTEITLTLSIEDVTADVDKCWLQVMIDGKVAFEETLNEGNSKVFVAKEKVYFVLGNPGVVKVKINDDDLGILGEKGQTLRKEITLEELKK